MNSLVFTSVKPKADTVLNYVHVKEAEKDGDMLLIGFSVIKRQKEG